MSAVATAPSSAAAIDLGDGLSHIATALRVPVLIAAPWSSHPLRAGARPLRGRMVAALAQSRFDLREVVAEAIAEPANAAHYAR